MKILVINTKFMGDLILSAPGLKALRENYPESEIVMMTRNGYESTLINNPDINRIIQFDFRIKKNAIRKRIAEEIKFIRQVRAERFDVVIALHPGDRIAFLAWFSGASIRIAPRKQAFNFLFNILVDVEEDTISYMQYYNRLFAAFIKKEVTAKTEFFVTEVDRLWAAQFLSQNNIEKADLVIGIHPGASEPTKIWPVDNYAGLIRELISLGRIRIILIAGPADTEIVDGLFKKANDRNISVYNSDDVNRTAALIQKCNLFISNDTGTRHLSVALKIPVIALMPDDNQKCWNFYNESDKHFVITGKREYPTAGLPFLGSIAVKDVFDKAKEVLHL